MQNRSYKLPQEFLSWLNGETIEEKLRQAEKGKLVVCVRCDEPFFDKETDEERQLTECKTRGTKHECIEYANYIVLRRGFRNILDAICYFDGDDPTVEVIRYFDKKSKRRKSWKS